jgi:ribosomal protein S18 acetylase RimI-like enzyme
MRVRELTSSDISWVESIVTKHFGSPRVVSRQVIHDAHQLPGFVAEVGSERAGLLQYHIDGSQCEIVILISVKRRRAIGTRLLEAAREMARDRRCNRLWLITTNDNRIAQELYAAVGGRRVAIHKGAVREARKLKPEIPEFDGAGNPIEDEIEFEFGLDS